MARTADYNYDSAFDPEEQRRRVAAVFDDGTPPPPPTEDHPMVAFAKNLLSPMYGSAVPTANEAGTDGGFNYRTRDDIMVRVPQLAPDILGGIGKFLGENPRGDPSPLGRLAGGALEFSGIASRLRATALQEAIDTRDRLDPSGPRREAENKQARAQMQQELMGTIPGVGIGVGAISKQGKKIEKAAEGFLGRSILARSAEQAAAVVGEVTGAQRAFADDLARQVAEREAAAGVLTQREIGKNTPGFLQTAEQKIAQGTSTVVAGPLPGTPVFGNDAAYQLGVRADKLAAAAGDDVAEILVRDALDDIAASGNDIAAATQRRGVVPVEESLNRLADAVGISTEKMLKTKAGTAMNSEELVQTWRSMQGAAGRVKDLRTQIQQVGTSGAKRDLEMQLLAASAEMSRLREVFTGARAEAGRGLNILGHLQKAAKSSDESAYDAALTALGGRANKDEYIKRLDDIWLDPSRTDEQRLLDTMRFSQNLGKADNGAKIGEAFISSILSLPITQIVNTTSSLALAVVRPLVTLGSASVEAAVTLGGKTRQREVFFSQPAAEAVGLVAGLMPAVRAFFYVAKNEITPTIRVGTEKIRLGANKTDLRINEGRALEGIPGAVLTAPLRAMKASDTAIKVITLKGGIYEEAARIASSEKQSILSGDWGRRVAELVASPTEAMIERGLKQGLYATLQSDPGKTASAFAHIRREIPGMGFVIPFIVTPTNIIRRGLEMSPLGYLKAPFYKTAEERAAAISRATIGTIVMTALTGKFVSGEMTGAWPKNPAERDEWERSGKRPYAMKVGNEWVEYRRFEPFSTPLYVTAAMYDTWKRGELQGAAFDVLAQRSAFAMVRSLADATWFSGLSRLVDAVEDPQASGERFLTNLATAFVMPASLYRGLALAGDKWDRDPKDAWEEILAMIPGKREEIRQRLDAYGQPIERPESRQGLGALFNPLVVSSTKQNAVDQMIAGIERLPAYDVQGNALPAQPFRVGFVDDEVARMRLNVDESYRLQQLAGQKAYIELDKLRTGQRLYNGKTFAQLDPVEQRKAAEKARDDGRDSAKQVLASELMAAADKPQTVFRAARIHLSTITKLRDQAYYVEGLAKQGKLTEEAKRLIDTEKGSRPSVNEYLRDAPLIHQYLQTKPYVIGNPTEWKALVEAKKFVAAYVKANPKPAGMADWQWAYRANPGAANLVRKYSYEWTRNPKRAALLKKHPEIEKYV